MMLTELWTLDIFLETWLKKKSNEKTGVEMRLEFETHKHVIFAFPNINPERVTEKGQA